MVSYWVRVFVWLAKFIFWSVTEPESASGRTERAHGMGRVYRALPQLMPDHAVKKHGGMGHPAIRLFGADLMPIRADQVWAVEPIKPTASGEPAGVRMTVCADQVRQIDQHIS